MSTVEKSDGDEYVDPYLYVTGYLMEELYKKTQITSKAMETLATTTTLITAASSSSSSNNLNAVKMAELKKKKRDEIRKWLLGEYKEKYRDQYNNDSRFVFLISNYLRHILK
jgi:hypothetical protein